MGLAEAFRHSWYQSKVRVNIRKLERYIALFRSLYTAGRDPEISGMADKRDWGGGGDDPEESTQRMIERIWESLTDIR
ncbi:hypothetical protein Taro_051000 [Colocasia esculenta]|uniref:Uncharacterized protein n=1 Tax=Colocasia esculenta TaxID=4460 RepID=A0A843XFT8_COLES|nr:hypothetical protein [Colocasia esculenta]